MKPSHGCGPFPRRWWRAGCADAELAPARDGHRFDKSVFGRSARLKFVGVAGEEFLETGFGFGIEHDGLGEDAVPRAVFRRVEFALGGDGSAGAGAVAREAWICFSDLISGIGWADGTGRWAGCGGKTLRAWGKAVREKRELCAGGREKRLATDAHGLERGLRRSSVPVFFRCCFVGDGGLGRAVRGSAG